MERVDRRNRQPGAADHHRAATSARIVPMRHAFVGIVAVVVALSACTSGSASGPPTATSGPAPDVGTDETISVTLLLPSDGHSEPIRGDVTSSDGSTVATFEFPPDFEFAEDPSANRYRPATSSIADVDAIVVELPSDGSYTFATHDSFFWGGCGTCGTFYAGGDITTSVDDGSVVELDLGEVSGET